ncbi:hypothetical protein [Brevundimonas bullata]|uniref:hypothetical protein n=1 Tax=Brevundimonas bullata TaxID=13160 RepID=UPI003D9A10DF
MLGLSIALSGALLIQSQTPAPTDDLTPAQVEQVVPLLMQTFETFGSCEQFFPPEVAQQFRAQLAAPKDADVATLMVLGLLEEAYERGQELPEAEALTREECSTALKNLQTTATDIQSTAD